MMNPDRYLKDPEVDRVDHPCNGIWFVRYTDGSVAMKDDHDFTIRTPMNKYDVVQDLQFLGTYRGRYHFAYKACEYGHRNHPYYGIFDSQGHEKIFKDPRLYGLESIDRIKAEFDRIVKESKDPLNPRREDSQMWDMDRGKGQKISLSW